MDETLPSWVGTDLIENGDFEDNPVTGASGWGLFDAIPGWIAIQGDLEIQKGENAVSDLGVAGNGLVELAGRENSGIQQTVTVAEGQEGIYLLSLDHARRRDDNWIASFDVLVDGVVVASVDTSVQGSVQQFELEVALTEGDHTIAFVETSRNDGRGTLIDNVSLVATGEPLPGVEPEPQGLSLSLSEGVIAEDGSTVATILRTGDVGLDAPLVVSVEVSGGDEAAPAVTEVSFAAGELSRDVVISGLLDGVVDGSQDVNVVVRSGVLEASASLTVTDVDVAPDPEPGANLIENGDFEDNPVTGASGWGLFDAIPGWIAIQGDLEIQKGENAVSDLGVAGNGLVELAGRENSGIQQTVTVAEGQEGIYLLSLDHARRRDDNWIASFDVVVDGVVVASVDTSVQGSVQQFELEVALTEGDHTIAFVETSRNDGRGTLIDNVSLVATGEPLPGVEPEPQGLSLSLSEGVIAEDGSTVATILRTGDVGLDAPLVVSVEVSGGDEAAPAVTEVSFAAGELSRDVVISGLLDGVVDGSQDVNVVVRSGVLEASASLTVTDVDVAPDPEPGANLIENGDFEDNPVTGASGWGLFDAIPSWIAIQGDLEIQKGENAVSDLGVADNGLVELAGRENSGIQQTVTVAEGQEGIYLLSLDHARRRDDNWIASFDVVVDGVVVASVDTSVQGSVQQFELEVALTEGDHTIAFVETSRNDGRGTLIDNVSLVATGEPLPPPPPADTLSFSDEADGRLVDLGNGSWSIPLKFLPLGDSITYGIEIGPAQANDTSLGGYRDDLWQSFVAQGILIDYVGRQATGPDNLLDQNHEGTPGIRADQIANYLAAQLPSFVPDVVLLMAGTNDSYQQVSNAGETTPQDIERLINIILAENPDAQIFVSTLLPQDPVNPRNAEALPGLAVANQGIMDLVARLNADGLTNIHLVDMSDLSLDLISDVGPDNRNDDGLHPTDEGYTEIASRWHDAINQAFADLGLVLEGDGNAIDSIIQNVIGSTGNDYLIGDARDNDLNGLAGNDILDGGAGNDSLTGSFGRDLFRVSEGNDVITDFDPSSDFIDLKGTGFTSFSEILAAAEQQGSDVVLFGDVAEMGMLTLQGVLLSDLSEDHFLYDSGDTTTSAVTMASSSGNTMTAVSRSGEAEAHGEIVALYSDADWFDSDGGSRESMMDDRDSGDWSDNGVDDYSQPPIWDAWT